MGKKYFTLSTIYIYDGEYLFSLRTIINLWNFGINIKRGIIRLNLIKTASNGAKNHKR